MVRTTMLKFVIARVGILPGYSSAYTGVVLAALSGESRLDVGRRETEFRLCY